MHHAQKAGRSAHRPGACETGERTVTWRTLGVQKGAETLLLMEARHRARLTVLRRAAGEPGPSAGAEGGLALPQKPPVYQNDFASGV